MSIVSRAFWACFSGRMDRMGAHIVQAVGQFDQNHPQIARHGDQQFAEVLGLLGLGGGQLKVGQLGDTIHQFHDFRAEQTFHL